MSAVSLGAVIAIELVLTGDLVQGPVARDGRAIAVVVMTAVLLGAAAVTTSLVLASADFAWRADGVACGLLLLCLAGTVMVGWEYGPDPLRVVGSVLAPLATPTMLDVVERRTRGARTWTLMCGVVVGAVSVGRYLVRDPFLDPDCWADCSLRDVAPLSSPDAARLADSALGLVTWAVAVLASALVVLGTAARHRSGRPRPAGLDLGVAAVAAIGLLLAGLAVLPSDRDLVASTALLAVSAEGVLALLVTLQPARAVRRRHKLRRLALDLGEVPAVGSLEQTLARVLDDRDLRVGYWLAESRRYVDARGEPVDGTLQWSVSLQRDGEPLALIHLQRADREAGELEKLIGSAARLAIDSERLQAELRSQLAELRASRQRIVDAADATRRSIERHLHDIVQAELLGALFELARMKAEAERNGESRVAQRMTQVAGHVHDLGVGLREFARGVYPAVLDGSGLSAALDALADEAPVVVTVSCRLDRRPPPEAERAAYLLIHDVVMGARHELGVDVSWEDSALVVHISGHADQLREDLVDRIGALGGVVTVDAGVCRAVLPCG